MVKVRLIMGFKDKLKEFGGGDFTFLSEDGEQLVCVIVDLPVLLKSKFQGKEQDRIGIPCMTEDGYALFITGKRVARKVSKFENRFADSALVITRHGESGDVNSRYTVSVLEDGVITKELLAMAKKEYKPQLTEEAVKEASKILG